MSRVAKNPVVIPDNVTVDISDQNLIVKGPNGTFNSKIHSDIVLVRKGDTIHCDINENSSGNENLYKFAGTTQALIKNMIKGVTQGFEKTLQLVGVGYKANIEGENLKLSLGFSHSCFYNLPKDVKIICVSPTEIKISGLDKQKVGQVAADIRSFRPPEPYKGKGVRYINEVVIIKEAKKK